MKRYVDPQKANGNSTLSLCETKTAVEHEGTSVIWFHG